MTPAGVPGAAARLADEQWFRSVGERARPVEVPGVLSGHLRPGVLGGPIVERPRISRALRRDGSPTLVVVTGPAGSGKSTALCRWVSTHADHDRVGWLALHPSHDSFERFWLAIVAALRVAGVDVAASASGGELAALVREPGFVDGVIVGLVDEPTEVALVVDDYHVVTDDRIHESFGRLVAEAHPALVVGIGSRSQPPLRLSRLRATRPVAELQAAELALTVDEVAEILAMRYGVQPDSVVSELMAATGGWPAMVSLAVAVAERPGELSSMMRRGLAADRWLSDFVVDELVDAQPDELRRFLLDTAFLAELSAPLCDAALGRRSSARHLETLDHMGLLVSLDDDGEWWRHHHLVSDVLRRRVIDDDVEQLAQRRTQAARWFASVDRHFDAVELALAAARFDLAGEYLVTALARQEPAEAALTTAWWFDELPDEVLVARPGLLGDISVAVAVSGTDGQRKRLAKLTDETGEDAAAGDGGVDWETILGADLPAAFAALRAVDLAALGEVERRYLLGICPVERLAARDAKAAWDMVRVGLADAPQELDCRALSGIASVAAHHRGDTRTADELVAPYNDVASETMADFTLDWARGIRAARCGEVAEAGRHFDAAMEWAHGWFGLLVRIEQAEALAATGATAEATAAFDDARRRLREFTDPGPLGARVAALADRLDQVDPAAARRVDLVERFGLSDRELEVLVALRSGGSLREIADRLDISLNTVKSHTRSLYRKMGVSGRDGAVGALTDGESST